MKTVCYFAQESSGISSCTYNYVEHMAMHCMLWIVYVTICVFQTCLR